MKFLVEFSVTEDEIIWSLLTLYFKFAFTQGIVSSSTRASADGVGRIVGDSSEDGVGGVDETPDKEEDIVILPSTGLNGDELVDSAISPVAMTNTIRVREEFSREYWRTLLSKKNAVDASSPPAAADGNPSSVSSYFSVSPAITVQEVQHANPLQTLDTEEAYRYYAQ